MPLPRPTCARTMFTTRGPRSSLLEDHEAQGGNRDDRGTEEADGEQAHRERHREHLLKAGLRATSRACVLLFPIRLFDTVVASAAQTSHVGQLRCAARDVKCLLESEPLQPVHTLMTLRGSLPPGGRGITRECAHS